MCTEASGSHSPSARPQEGRSPDAGIRPGQFQSAPAGRGRSQRPVPGNQPQGCCAQQVPDVQYCAANSSARICPPTDLLPPNDGCAGSGPAVECSQTFVQPGNNRAGEGSPLPSSPGTQAAFVGSSEFCDLVLPPHMLMALSCPPAPGGVIKTPSGPEEGVGEEQSQGVSNPAHLSDEGGGRVLPAGCWPSASQGCELR